MSKRWGLLLGLMLAGSATWAAEQTVKVLSPARFALQAGDLSIGLSQDWRQPLPQISRAVIIIHGRLRNAQSYLRSAEDAARHAGQSASTLLIAPQFLNDADIKRHRLGDTLLHWQGNHWMAGESSIGRGQISSYGVLDQIIEHLGNRQLFPGLKEIVVAGHSGGGQVVQRFALTGHDHPTLRAAGISLRYVIANPSSYAYFSPQRPVKFEPASCVGFNEWKYGMQHLPAYANGRSHEELETAYAAKDITYLLGQQDTDPNHPALDKSCAAEVQGAYRLIRGQHYFDYLKRRHPQIQQKLIEVPGVGHNGDKMFTSPEGQAALFD
ncbi:alpha/beta hydrolase [Pseudomonas mucidolens]|uniref:alpha/beta hydrolase n=1 Tax=Pseudomonas mucidolens TaxID=46679 RepID=UPI0030DD40B7